MEDKDDGTFFISLDDLMVQFHALTICKIFPDNMYKDLVVNVILCIKNKGEWKKNQAGYGNVKNVDQIGLKITKNCKLVLILIIQEI